MPEILSKPPEARREEHGADFPSQPLEETNFTHCLILDFSLKNHQAIHLCRLRHPVSGTRLWQPRQAHPGTLRGNNLRARVSA